MQEMVQNIIDIESKTYNQEQLYMLAALKVSAVMLLKNEKTEIKMAYSDGRTNGLLKLKKTPEEYYNLTYNQKGE